jgi:hypothetical protein
MRWQPVPGETAVGRTFIMTHVRRWLEALDVFYPRNGESRAFKKVVSHNLSAQAPIASMISSNVSRHIPSDGQFNPAEQIPPLSPDRTSLPFPARHCYWLLQRVRIANRVFPEKQSTPSGPSGAHTAWCRDERPADAMSPQGDRPCAADRNRQTESRLSGLLPATGRRPTSRLEPKS